MGRPRRLVVGPSGALVVEYLRGRRTVRLVNRADGRGEVVEMPLDSFLSGLGLEAADRTPARHYLLFAGAGSGAGGGLRELRGAFDSEKRARDAFRDLRLSTAFSGGWAELVVVQPGTGLVPVCWFGRAASKPTKWRTTPPAGRSPRRGVSLVVGEPHPPVAHRTQRRRCTSRR